VSVALVLGWNTRAVAILLAGFSLLTALIFHVPSAPALG
jgi:putative oxidoreductase